LSVRRIIRSTRRTSKQRVYRTRPRYGREHLTQNILFFDSNTKLGSISFSVELDQLQTNINIGVDSNTFNVQLDQLLIGGLDLNENHTFNVELDQLLSAVRAVNDSIIFNVQLDEIFNNTKITNKSSTFNVQLDELLNVLKTTGVSLSYIVQTIFSLGAAVPGSISFNIQLDKLQTAFRGFNVSETFNVQLDKNQTNTNIGIDSSTFNVQLDQLQSAARVTSDSVSFVVQLLQNQTRSNTGSATFNVELDQLQTRLRDANKSITFNTQLDQIQSIIKTTNGIISLIISLLQAQVAPGTPDLFLGNFLFKRDTNIYISKSDDAGANATNTVQVSVKDFDFNKQSISELVSRETMDATQTRGVKPHISAVSPVSFSFVTYMNPLVDTNVTSPEEYLWLSLMGADIISSNPTTSTIDFADGNVKELQNLTLWFDRPNMAEGNYRLDNAVVDSANISFSLNEIAEIKWSGRALSITEDNTPPDSTDRTSTGCIHNKLSTITLNMDSVSYVAALKGGGIQINNNNVFYGRQQLGETTIPVGHYTGKRVFSGNLNFYLKVGTNTTVDMFNVLLNNATNDDFESTHLANITVNIGGTTAPFVQVNIPRSILDLGRQEFGEVISVDIPFTAQEEAGFYSTIIYNA